MDKARDIIATTYIEGRTTPIGPLGAEAVMAMLTSAGYRIIPPGEFDRVSLEAAAEIAEGYAFATAKIDSWGVRFEPNVRTAGSGIATAIRRLAEITA